MRWAPLLGLLAAAGCGVEDDFSGVWLQQERPAPSDDPCSQAYFSLHAGQYGRDLAGLLFAYTADGTQPFDAVDQRACFVLSNGSAVDDVVTFNLRPQSGVTLLPGCDSPLLTFRVDDDTMEGTLECGELTCGPLLFQRGRGRPHTTCGDPQ